MKYYKIKYRYEDLDNYNFWVCRSGSLSNCGFVRRISRASRASIFSKDALQSIILQYYLSFIDYQLVEVYDNNPPVGDIFYKSAKDLDQYIFKYNIPDNVLSGKWFADNENRVYYKVKALKQNGWFTYNACKGIYVGDNFTYGIIVSKDALYDKSNIKFPTDMPYALVETQKPWHFSKIFYDSTMPLS